MHRPPYVDAMKLFSHPVNDCEEHWRIHTHHPLELQNNLKYTRSLLLSLISFSLLICHQFFPFKTVHCKHISHAQP